MANTDWLKIFPDLQQTEDSVLTNLLNGAQRITVAAGEPVFRVGALCDQYLLVTSGSVRVQLNTGSGRQVVLYRVQSGQSCILTTSCVVSGERYPAEGITETEVEAVALSESLFNRAMRQSEVFRNFVFRNFSQRLVNVIARMEEVAYGSIDARLCRFLEAGEPIIRMTHEELARELGTVREVVSRHLTGYQKEGWIRLGRGVIEVLDTKGLNSMIRKAD